MIRSSSYSRYRSTATPTATGSVGRARATAYHTGPAASPTVAVSFETNRFYQPGLLDAPDPWLWEALASGAVRAKSFSLAGVDTSRAAELEVFLQGASESGQPIDHHLTVSVNGVLVGEARFAAKQPYRLSASLPPSLLREGVNELSLANVADTGVTSMVFLDRFAVSHSQVASLASGSFEGLWSESGTATLPAPVAPVALLDLTPAGPSGAVPDALRWLGGYEAAGGWLRFRAEAGHRYLAVTESGLAPLRVAAPFPSTLRSAQSQADYILIAPRAFLAAAEPLVPLPEPATLFLLGFGVAAVTLASRSRKGFRLI